MEIRRFQIGEEAALWSVYFGSTRNVVAQEYTAAQVRRWAPNNPDMEAWTRRLARTRPFVAVINGELVGFAELEPDGHIDYFYCHQDFQRRGIGSALLAAVEDEARRLGFSSLFAEVSTTGIPFFLAKGFLIEEERTKLVCNAPAKQSLVRKRLEMLGTSSVGHGRQSAEGTPMDRDDWQPLVEQLHGAAYQFGVVSANSPVYRVEFGAGLSDAEVAAAESRFALRFPPDLRAFLQTALPQGPQFPDWRAGDELALREWLDRPRQGVLLDIEQGGFWLAEGGPRPPSMAEALRLAGELIAAAPRLIPIYAHRMIPDEPHLPGNPVFSVYQTDIIYYGFDLADYLRHEFALPGREPFPEQPRPIRFWDQIVS